MSYSLYDIGVVLLECWDAAFLCACSMNLMFVLCAALDRLGCIRLRRILCTALSQLGLLREVFSVPQGLKPPVSAQTVRNRVMMLWSRYSMMLAR